MTFILKMAWRDSRASRRRLVLFSFSVVLGIAALVAIGSLGTNLERGIDAQRRAGFLPLLESAHKGRGQVFMTCTEENWPHELARDLQRWEVKAGTLQKWE